MNLRSAYPYWLFHSPLLYTYSTLNTELKTDVVIVGSGISGALAAYSLIKSGLDVTIVSKDHVGTQSTCASSSLLQYEIDMPLVGLSQRVGEKNARRAYWLNHDAIDELESIHVRLGLKSLFQRRKSLQLSSFRKDITGMMAELRAKREAGFDVEWLTQEEVQELFGFNRAAAMYSRQGGQTDCYLLTQKLVKACFDHGMHVFDKVEIKDIKSEIRSVILTTSDGVKIKAKYAVMATGYESVKWIDHPVAQLHSTFCIVSEPFDPDDLWRDECLIWETSRPYTYMRTTPDHRVLIGGKDLMFNSPGKRDALIKIKSCQLQKAFNQFFPALPFHVEYAWAGTFADTKDGLPYIGIYRKLPRVFFALGFGGNGITFSQVAANLIRDAILGKKNSDMQIFRFEREK